jgi:undecaprenyl-diphosphatase
MFPLPIPGVPPMSAHIGFLEAGVIGLVQGVTELFPVSSLGHAVLIPKVIGGSWARDLDVSAPESPYLAFIVGLHVATALALIVYFRADWVRIIRGLATSIWRRKVETPDERLAWLLILATIPVGIAGLLLEHTFRTVLGKPTPAALFLVLNGLILLAVDSHLRARYVHAPPAESTDTDEDLDHVLAAMPVRRAVFIGAAQIAALAPGISRSGIALAAGLTRGLERDVAARFSFLLATPVILAAGVLKIPDLFGPLGNGIRGQVLFGSVLCAIAAYLSVRFLERYFRSRSARPFGWYCIAAGIFAVVMVNR